jgi:hypothetical protein
MNNIKTNKKKRKLIIPLTQTQKAKNECLRSLNTKESLKCIKTEKKIDMENIFIKNKNDKNKKINLKPK